MIKNILIAVTLAYPAGVIAEEQVKPVRLPAIPSPQTEVQPSFFFDHQPFVSPKIVQDLSVWISDRGDQVVAINLLESQDKNRYFGDIQVGKSRADGKYPFVSVEEKDKKSEFGYQYIGTTTDGVIVLFTSDWGGGTGHFENLILLVLEKDKGIDIDWEKQVVKKGHERLLIKKLGEIALGDRWRGELSVKGNRVFIGKDGDHKGTVEGRALDVSKDMLIDVK